MKRIILFFCLPLLFAKVSNAQTDVINIIPGGNVGISSTAPVSSFEVSGSFGQKVTTVTVNTVLDATHNTVVCNNGATAITVTLPTASTATGRVYVIKRNAASTANVTITGTPTLDGVGNYVLTMPNQSIQVFSDGSEWKTTSGGSSTSSTAWGLTGNGGTTASTSPIGTAANNNFIGTTDGKDFVLAANNLERMRITSGGNVGIGTSSITNGKLAVVDNGLNTHAMQIIHTNATNSNGLNIQTQTNLSSDFALRIVPNAGTMDAFIVRNTGNIGIGTASPTALLNISSASTSTPIHLNNTATGTTSTDGGRIAVHDAGAFSFTNYESSAFLFNTSGVTERMRLTDAGNLGIGTATPQQMLQVGTGANRYFQVSSTGLITGRFDNNGLHAILTMENRSITGVDHGVTANFNLNQSGAAGILSGQIRVSAEDTYNAAANQDSYMSFTTALDGSPTEKMRIKSDGNVGILTSAPAYTLQVGQNTAGNNANYSVGILRHGDLTTAGTYSLNVPALQIWDAANDGPATLESTGMVSIAVPRIGDADLNSANALVFSVSNDNGYALTVKGNRNVGIGTNTPNQRLEVLGNARITALASGANGAIVRSNSSGDLSVTNFTGSGTDVLTGAGTFAGISTISGDDWTQSGSILYPNTNGWNVGIGTSSPSYKLHVAGDINFTSALKMSGVDVLYGNSADVYANIRVIRNTSSVNTDGMYIGYGNSGTTSGHLRFYANGTTERMVISASDGSVTVNNLAGSGTRPAYVTSAGTFTATAPTSGTIGYWQRSGSNLFPLNTGDNVGIGTNSAPAKLAIQGAGYTQQTVTWPDFDPDQNANSFIGYRSDAGGNGSIATAGTGPSDIFYLAGNYYDSRAVITIPGSGGASPADQGTGRGKDLMLLAGRSDNNNGLVGGRLLLQGGSGYSGGYGANYGSVILQSLGGNTGIGVLSPGHKLHIEGATGAYPIRIGTPDGYIAMGSLNSSWAHIETDRPRYYFNKGITADGGLIGSYDEDLQLQTQGTTRITVLNANGNVGIASTNPQARLDIQGGAVRQEGLTTYVKTLIAGSSGQTFNLLRQYHDYLNWGFGGALIEVFPYYYQHSVFDYGMYMAKYGYSGLSASVVTKIAGGPVPFWTAYSWTGVGDNYYRDLQITVPAYQYITIRITTAVPITNTLSNTAQNLIYLY